jgi:hypothetical protein
MLVIFSFYFLTIIESFGQSHASPKTFAISLGRKSSSLAPIKSLRLRFGDAAGADTVSVSPQIIISVYPNLGRTAVA